jgi:hypothetical protein
VLTFITASEGSPIVVQGFDITPPASPPAQGQFITSPTPLQAVAKTTIQTGPAQGENPPPTVPVAAQFQWVTVYQAQTQRDPAKQSVSVTTGVTSSESQTQQFAVSIGMEEGASFGPISAKLNESFTATMGTTTTISMSSSTTVQNEFSVEPETTGQFWQLWQVFTTGTGASLAQQLNVFLSLTYPA